MMNARQRRRLRTAILGLVAFAALIWGAVDIVGVPVENLWRHMGELLVALVVVIALALLPAGLLIWLKSRGRSQ